MVKPIQLRLPPGVEGGRVVLLDARLAEHTTFEDLRAAMRAGRLVAEEMDVEPAPAPARKKARSKTTTDAKE